MLVEGPHHLPSLSQALAHIIQPNSDMAGIPIWLMIAIAFLLQMGAFQLPPAFQTHRDSKEQPRKRVGNIGSGVAGASTAYHLHELTKNWLPVDFTIHEQEQRVGGRIKSANAFGHPEMNVETGASTFSTDEWCIKRAVCGMGLEERQIAPKVSSGRTGEKKVGVWDSHTLAHVNEARLESWLDLARSMWTFGLPSWRL